MTVFGLVFLYTSIYLLPDPSLPCKPKAPVTGVPLWGIESFLDGALGPPGRVGECRSDR